MFAKSMPATIEPPENQNERPRKSRLETEIEEILARSEAESPLPPPTPIRRPEQRQNVRESLDKVPLHSIMSSARQWLDTAPLLVAFILAIFALVISDLSLFLATIAALFSVIALFWPILSQFRSQQSSGQKMWRGRPYEISSSASEPAPFERVRQWLRDRNIGR